MTYKDDEFWLSMFENIQMEYIPFAYVQAVTIRFENGSKQCIVSLPKEIVDEGIGSFVEFLNALSRRYRKNITDVSFKLDVDRFKEDVINRTKHYL